MNIFVLHRHPRTAARDHCDKHVVKMIVEYAQMLSTAHRQHDGVPTIVRWQQPIWENRRQGFGTYSVPEIVGHKDKHRLVRLLEGETAEMKATVVMDVEAIPPVAKTIFKLHINDRKAYNETHANHPCAVWARQTHANYEWLHELWVTLMEEYTHRYGKRHAAMDYLTRLSVLPDNIEVGELTEFPQAMPPQYQVPNDPVAAYHRFYVGQKSRFARWTNTEPPQWFQDGIALKEGRYDASRFERTR